MAYYLAVETENNNYVALRIKKSGYFGRKNNYQANCEYQCTLEEIDSYTMKFMDESGVKDCLFSEKILPKLGYGNDKPLAIIYTDESNVRIVKGNVLYKTSKKMKENPYLVTEYIQTKYQNNDFSFFQNLTQVFSEDSPISNLISKVVFMIEKKLIADSKAPGEECLDQLVQMINDSINQDYEILHNIISIIDKHEETLSKSQKSGYTKARKPHH